MTVASPVRKEDCRPLSYAAGDLIYAAGEAPGFLYLIQEGEVDISTVHELQEIVLAHLVPGDFFGEDDLLEQRAHLSTARAATACSLLAIDESTFAQILKAFPETSLAMLRRLGRRVRSLELALATLPKAPPLPLPSPPAPVSSDGEMPKACLYHAPSDTVILLSASQSNLIGRSDPALPRPEIELSHLDPGRTLSRRHARIEWQGKHYVLTEEAGVTNGTWAAGHPVAHGRPYVLHRGYSLQFGAVHLEFRHLSLE